MTEAIPASAEGIARAAAMLRDGRLVAFGTETVYGLGADATRASSVARVFDAKGRPHFNPLICHYPDAVRAFVHVVANETAHRLAEAFWPGPLTLVLPRRVTCPVALLAGAGLDTLAVRVPQGDTVQALLTACGRPIAAPSANRSGQVSPTTADHVMEGLAGRIDAVLDRGPCRGGVESTVLDLTGPRPFLLRPGGVTREAIEALIGPIGAGLSLAQAEASRGLRSPGLLVSHYAPGLPVRLHVTEVAADEALLAFGPPLPGGCAMFQLSLAGDPVEAASRLFEGLRRLDGPPSKGIAVMPIPASGLGAAINDLLQRAAAPRGSSEPA